MILLFKVPGFSASSHFGTVEHRFSSGPAWLNTSVSFSCHKQPTSRVLPPNKQSCLVWVLKTKIMLTGNCHRIPKKFSVNKTAETFHPQRKVRARFIEYDRLVQVLLSFPGSAGSFVLLHGSLLPGENGSGKLFDLIPKVREVTEGTSELVCF